MKETVLALDASGKTASVCVMRDGAVLYDELLDKGLTHSETLLPLVQKALAETGLAPGDVTLYAVTQGPGSFTGLRIGIALVKGLAQPHDTPAVGISTLEALAKASGLAGIVVPALDARRGEVYWAAFDTRDGFARIAPDKAGPAADIGAALGLEERRARGENIFFVGDGAQICYTIYDYDSGYSSGEEKGRAPAPVPIAVGAAALAWQGRVPAQSAEALRPVYLRLSQAERERAKKMEAM